MKLRIRGNSIRLRLTKSEVATLGAGGRVQEETVFSTTNKFAYALEATNVAQVEANFTDGCINIRIPQHEAQAWANTESVGIEAEQSALKIIIEKDFACLSPRGEEDSDTFEHPRTGQSNC